MDYLEILIPGLNYTLGQILFAIIIIAIGVIIARLVRMSVAKIFSQITTDNASNLVQRIVYYAVIIIVLLAVLSYLGIDFTGALLAGGILGIVIGFATQSVVSNLISGLFLQLDKPVSIGDPIGIIDSNLSGVIIEINIFSTTLRTFDGVNLRVPNERMFTSKIYNYTRNVARRAIITMGIAYKEDMVEAITLIKKTLNDNPLVLIEPEPLVYVDVLSDSSVDLSIRAWTPSTVWFTLRTQMVQEIKKALDDADIEIPFPQRVIYKGDD
jgi:small-conductance mechanosensitive channel